MKHMEGDVCPSVIMYVSVTHQIWLDQLTEFVAII